MHASIRFDASNVSRIDARLFAAILTVAEKALEQFEVCHGRIPVPNVSASVAFGALAGKPRPAALAAANAAGSKREH